MTAVSVLVPIKKAA